jgi:hypothetical protein
VAVEDELGTRLARTLGDGFALEGEIGRGGMGIVYRARDQRLKRSVAVKVLPPELAYRADVRLRFLREAETAAQLTHPHIVPIFTVDERDGIVYFIMAYVDGDTLGARLAPGLPLPVADARRIAREVADALAYAHGRGVVHRDIKPDNILLSREGMRAMVTDFGIARALTTGGGTDGGDTRLTATGVAIGTPAYMSPEQCAGDRAVDGRSDLYSLGVVAYQMLCGSPPFAGVNTVGMLLKQVTERPVPLRDRQPDVPPQLANVVMRLLEKDPAERIPTATALVAALDGAPVAAPSPEPAAATEGEPSDTVVLTVRKAKKMKQTDVQTVLLDKRVRKFRGQCITAVATTGFLFGLNAVTDRHEWWAVYVALAFGLSTAIRAGKLLTDGVTLAEAFGPLWPGQWGWIRSARGGALLGKGKPTLPNATAQAETRATRLVPREVLDGPYGPAVRRAVADQISIVQLYDSLDKGERALVPDIVTTAHALLDQVGMVAVALHRLDVDTPDAHRAALADRRSGLVSQLERACLALEALALDLIRLRSAGLSEPRTGGGGTATDQARAVLLDIDYVLQAAADLRTPDPRSSASFSEPSDPRVLKR